MGDGGWVKERKKERKKDKSKDRDNREGEEEVKGW